MRPLLAAPATAIIDLNVWDKSGEVVHVGRRRARWGWLRRHGRGGPEVFVGQAASDGPFTIKIAFFSGRPRDVKGKVRILRFANGTLRDESFRSACTVTRTIRR